MAEKKRTKRKEPSKREDQEKSLFQKVIDGDQAPQGKQKGWQNLTTGHREHNFAVLKEKDPDKAREIHSMGAQAVNRLHGEQKNAKQILDNVLSLLVDDEIINGADLPPEIANKLKKSNKDITMYELIQTVAAGRAAAGNMKAVEYIRDTYGDKPTEKLDITGEIMTDTDRAMLEKISRRLDSPDVVIAKDMTGDGEQD
jgi:hypothetical protein